MKAPSIRLATVLVSILGRCVADEHSACLPDSTPAPTAAPTLAPTAAPTPAPTAAPTPKPLGCPFVNTAVYIKLTAVDQSGKWDCTGDNLVASLTNVGNTWVFLAQGNGFVISPTRDHTYTYCVPDGDRLRCNGEFKDAAIFKCIDGDDGNVAIQVDGRYVTAAANALVLKPRNDTLSSDQQWIPSGW
ncbi:hypothetical protein SDRG_17350 [Saprolegnia diclina VS20]|uniref:Ricin B lectin domain-containing protein n=1 Tax=Saprolegnia diclina (strain VS20) TaxID=1156394 RepID=T0R5G7_SAPDV|nr:hypothetical protein SDRG_17350 [Saprolegnia diclina VS20]EQC24757.1 hypothetical protein SDRG_17350 [Saprolegnia diclina VS20]|eukprot:XP_008621813.1 hypothetical protein SDRG_17350 [Saprolegnia diclina VS20]